MLLIQPTGKRVKHRLLKIKSVDGFKIVLIFCGSLVCKFRPTLNFSHVSNYIITHQAPRLSLEVLSPASAVVRSTVCLSSERSCLYQRYALLCLTSPSLDSHYALVLGWRVAVLCHSCQVFLG